MLVDQPLITSEDILQLINRFNENPSKIIASEYPNEQLGVPTLFGRRYFELLSSLEGDAGARKLINLNINNVISVKLAHDLVDIDTQDIYESLYRRHHNTKRRE